jgi:hypothetical protein
MKQLIASIVAVAVVVVTDVLLLWPRCQTFTFPDAPPERDCTSYPLTAGIVTLIALVAGAIVLRVASRPDT